MPATSRRRPSALSSLLFFSLCLACVDCKGCPISKFDCGNGKCIRGTLWCDGKDNCGNGADEKSCTMCFGGSLKCTSLPRCVPHEARCNGGTECDDGSDEEGCEEHSAFNEGSSGATSSHTIGTINTLIFSVCLCLHL